MKLKKNIPFMQKSKDFIENMDEESQKKFKYKLKNMTVKLIYGFQMNGFLIKKLKDC